MKPGGEQAGEGSDRGQTGVRQGSDRSEVITGTQVNKAGQQWEKSPRTQNNLAHTVTDDSDGMGSKCFSLSQIYTIINHYHLLSGH